MLLYSCNYDVDKILSKLHHYIVKKVTSTKCNPFYKLKTLLELCNYHIYIILIK